MKQETIIANTEVSFKDFLFKNKRNRTILWIAAAAIVIQFAVFKYFYPFASYIHDDSFVYLKAAYFNFDINTYPIGYSRFLRFFSVFTKSDTALVAFQYFTIEASSLFLMLTLIYFYNPTQAIQYILILYLLINPLFLHLSNLVSSDCLFASLSLIWITLLIWIIHNPSPKIIYWHTLVLFFAFTIRYNALIYPLIAGVAFIISNASFKQKLIGITTSIFTCIVFIGFTCYYYKKLTGQTQYAPFSGWQLANNAMYTYRYVKKTERKEVESKYQKLDTRIREYFDSTRDLKRFPHEAWMANTVYMWTKALPLYKYQEDIFLKDSISSEFKKWAYMGPIYKDYGLFIIKKYPWHFVRYFIWPNSKKYYAPPIEFLGSFNSGRDTVSQVAQSWFRYKSNRIKTRYANNKATSLNFYPIQSGIVNIFMLFGLICYLFIRGWRHDNLFKKGVILFCAIWLFNALFTITASSAALRFQTFPLMLTSVFAVVLLDWIIKAMLKLDKINPIAPNLSKHKPQTSNLPNEVIA